MNGTIILYRENGSKVEEIKRVECPIPNYGEAAKILAGHIWATGADRGHLELDGRNQNFNSQWMGRWSAVSTLRQVNA